MTITLTPAQIEWLTAEVAAGRFVSVDEAAQAIIDEHMSREHDDLDWVEPLLQDARAEVARGEVVSWDDVKREMSELKARLRR